METVADRFKDFHWKLLPIDSKDKKLVLEKKTLKSQIIKLEFDM